MKQAIHSSRKSFRTWAMTGQRTESKPVKVHHNFHPLSIPFRMKPGGLIGYNVTRSLDSHRLNRPHRPGKVWPQGGALTRRGLNPKFYGRDETGAIRRLARKH